MMIKCNSHFSPLPAMFITVFADNVNTVVRETLWTYTCTCHQNGLNLFCVNALEWMIFSYIKYNVKYERSQKLFSMWISCFCNSNDSFAAWQPAIRGEKHFPLYRHLSFALWFLSWGIYVSGTLPDKTHAVFNLFIMTMAEQKADILLCGWSASRDGEWGGRDTVFLQWVWHY